MKFDTTRVYTAVNADELKIGSLIIVALNLEALERNVESETDIQKLEKIAGIDCGERFGVNIYHDKNNLRYYPLAYLIEAPKEPQYKPFSTLEKAMEAIQKHGGWVKHKCLSFLVTAYDTQFPDRSVYFSNCWYSLQELYSFFTFDDSTPCGELVE